MITLQDVTNAIQAKLDLENKIAQHEAYIAKLKQKVTLLSEDTIPCAFQELGIKEMKLSNGQKVKVDQDVYSSLSNENKPRAYSWLNSHNFGGMIKVELSINYSKGEKEKAEVKFKQLKAEGLLCELEENVHHATLGAFLREQIREGSEIPLELFGARPVFKTKISKLRQL